MSWLNSDTKVIRGLTKRGVDLAVIEFISKRSKKGESWYVAGEGYTPVRAIDFKPYYVTLHRV